METGGVLDIDDLGLAELTAMPVRDEETLLVIGVADDAATGRPTARCTGTWW